MSLHITKLTVRDLGNIDFYETKLGLANIIVGGNGTGKTNLVRVFRWIFNGGNDPELLRDGCEEGWAEFELSNGYKAHKHIWIKEGGDIGYELKVFTPEGAEKKGAKTFLDELMPKMSFDPDAFIEKPPKERAKFLLEHVHLEFTAEEVNDALNAKPERANVIAITARAKKWLAEPAQATVAAPTPIEKGWVKLERFDELYRLRYSQRTELNRLKDQIAGAVATLETGLSNEPEQDWGAERDRVQDEISHKSGEISSAEAKIKLDAEKDRSQENKSYQERATELRGLIAHYVASVKNFLESVERFAERIGPAPSLDIQSGRVAFVANVFNLGELEAKHDKNLEEISATERKDLATSLADLEKDRAALREQLGEAIAKANEQQRAIGVRNTIAEQKEYLAALEYTEGDLTRSIRALEQLKTSKLKAIDVKGFDLRFEKNEPIISINGRNFDRMNEQNQIFTAIKFVRLANPELSLIVCQSNALDAKHLIELQEAAEGAGIQCVLERCLADQPLKTVSVEEYLRLEKA